MVGLLGLVIFAEAMAYHVILCGQEPHVFSGIVRAERRWTTSQVGFSEANDLTGLRGRQPQRDAGLHQVRAIAFVLGN